MIYTLENDILKLEVSDIGGETRSLIKKSTGREYLFDGNPDWWDNISPVCFPVCGRFHNDKCTIDGVDYDLMIHGFVRRNPMERVHVTNTSITHLRKADEETKKLYPFNFEFYFTHELIDNKVKVTYRVVNKDEKSMPFQVGAHPAFKIKLGDKITLYSEKEQVSYKNLVEKLLPEESTPVDGKKITITKDLYAGNALMFTEKQLYAAGLEDENGEFIRVSFTGFPNCVFWSPNGAPFTCIEPWFGCDDLAGTDDDFRHRYCINTLLPGNEFEISYYINVL